MRSPLLAACAISSFAMGCTFSPTPEGPDAEATTSTATAIVVVERTAGPGDTMRDDAIIARFVRARSGVVDESALRVAGLTQELPALGQCSSRLADAPMTFQPREIDLLDVGPVTVESGRPASMRVDRSTVLLPRAMPDPTGIVSGVFYSARSAEAFAPASRLQLRATGGKDLVDGFFVNVAAPRDLADVHATSSSAGLELGWDTTDADARDVVYIDVLDKNARVVTRCATLDIGRSTVPSADLGILEEGQLAVHRLHRESFRAKGIEPGEVRFDLARVIPFRR